MNPMPKINANQEMEGICVVSALIMLSTAQ